MEIRHVLLTTDLSADAERAFLPAAEVARKYGARITLLHVVPDLLVYAHGAGMAPRQHAPEVRAEIEKAEPKLVEQAKKLPTNVPVKTEVLPAEDFAKAIAEYAGANQVDLLVMSTHGRSGMRRLVLGSVAEAVLRHARVPVLSIPPA